MRARWGWLLGGAATAALAAGLVGGIAAGQSGGNQPSPTPTTAGTPRASASVTPGAGAVGRADRTQTLNAYLDALARNLGVTPDALRAAMKKTALDQIAALEASGRLTPEQATRARQAVETGRAGIPPKFGHGRDNAQPGTGNANRDGKPSKAALVEALAKLAGTTAAQLQQEAQAAGSLGAAARARGVTEQQAVDAIYALIRPQFDAAVGEGRLTAQQAEQLARTQARRYARQLGVTEGRGR